MASAAPPHSTATQPSWVWDPAGPRFVAANAAAARFWGAIDADELISRPIHPDDPLARAMAALAEALSDEGDVRKTLRLHGAQGGIDATLSASRVALPTGANGLRVSIEPRERASDIDGVGLSTAAFANAPTPLFVLDAANRMVEANAAALALVAGVIERGGLFTDAVDDSEGLTAALAIARAEGATTVTATLLAARGPTRRHLVLRAFATGGAPHVVALAVEPAGAARAGDDAGQSDEGGTGLSERAPFGLALLDAETLDLLQWSASARRMLGFDDAANATGQSLIRLFPAHAEALQNFSREVTAQPDLTARLHLTRRAPDGATLYALGVIAARADANPPALELWLVDIGPEVRTMVGQRYDRDERRAAFEALGAGSMFLDERGAIAELDPVAAALTGAAAGDRLLAAAALGDQAALEAALDTDGASALDPVRLSAAPGAVRLALAPRRGGGGRARRGVAVTASADNAPAGGAPTSNAPLVEARAASDLSPGMSHAVRTALTTIRGFAELILEDPDEAASPRHRVYLDDIVDCAAELERVVDRAGAWPLARSDIDPKRRASLRRIVETALETPITTLVGRPVDVRTDWDAGSPDTETWFRAEEIREAIELAALALGRRDAETAARLTLSVRSAGAGAVVLDFAMDEPAPAPIESDPLRAVALRSALLLAEKRGAALATPDDGSLRIVAPIG